MMEIVDNNNVKNNFETNKINLENIEKNKNIFREKTKLILKNYENYNENNLSNDSKTDQITSTSIIKMKKHNKKIQFLTNFVQIIEVKSYKKYNLSSNFSEFEKNNNLERCECIII